MKRDAANSGKSRWRCLQCSGSQREGQARPMPIKGGSSQGFMNAFIHSLTRRMLYLTMGTGLNSLLLVPESFTHLRTLTSTNNIFILSGRKQSSELYKSTLWREWDAKSCGRDSFCHEAFSRYFRQLWTRVWPAFHSSLLLTYAWIRVHSVPVCFLVSMGKKINKITLWSDPFFCLPLFIPH